MEVIKIEIKGNMEAVIARETVAIISNFLEGIKAFHMGKWEYKIKQKQEVK